MYFFPITSAGRARRKLARALYESCIAQSRRPEFYTHLGIPDTFDGRFELIALNCGMLVERLSQKELGKSANKLAQALFDEMFLNLELIIREIGIGDLGVPRHIKRMMVALKGRAIAYSEALDQGSEAAREALARNLYGTVERPAETILTDAEAYLRALRSGLAQMTEADCAGGQINFPQLQFDRTKPDGQESKAA